MSRRRPSQIPQTEIAAAGSRLGAGLCVALIALIAVPFLLTAVSSIHWRIMHDAPIMLYVGYLLEHYQAVPYRDLFDMNMPGTLAVFAALGRLTGHSDALLRGTDLMLLLSLIGLTFVAMRPFGWPTALVAPLLYGLTYMGLALFHSLQREAFLLLPVVAAVAFVSDPRWRATPRGALAVGLGLGIAATIKPAILLDALPFAVFLWSRANGEPHGSRGRAGSQLLFFGAGIALPLIGCTLALASWGALGPFADIARHYWPLYGRLGSLHETIQDPQRLAYLTSGLAALGGHRLWLVGAVAGLVSAFRGPFADRLDRDRLVLHAGLLLMHGVYPASSGQFWPYHWFPFVWSLSCASALCLRPLSRPARFGTVALVAVFVATTSTSVRVPAPLLRSLAGMPVEDPYGDRVQEITSFLRANLRPEDTVQPLDWTGGAVDAMWRVRARIATPFVYDFHFYHHLSSPYIQRLRIRFMEALHTHPPTYFIRVWSRKPWPQGFDTTREFPALDQFIAQGYRVARTGDGYQILVRNR